MPNITGTLRCLSRPAATGNGAVRALCVPACALFVTVALSGCALYKTYEKCGFGGCAGDAAITANVVSQLNRSSFMEPNAVSVQTLDHVVYLNGVVRSGLEVGTAESIADHVPGVARVVNSIAVYTR
jgi:osmotically-inducible protein OsmY